MYKAFDIKTTSFPNENVSILDLDCESNVFSLNSGRKNGKAIQKAIDNLSKNGGGKLTITQGFWACSPIVLKSNINLHLERGSILKFIKAKEDYPLIITDYEGEKAIRTISPISAINEENIAITGHGIIDGSGNLWRPIKKFKLTDRQWEENLKTGGYILEDKETIWLPTDTSYNGVLKNIQSDNKEALKEASQYWDFYRPVMISLKHCKRVLLENVTFSNSPAWNIHPLFCEDLIANNIIVRNPYYAQNGDGIDVESCTRVEIKDSTFETGDDAICIKSGKNAASRKIYGPCKDIYIHNCTVYQGHGGFVVGSEMSRGVSNILVEDCSFIGTDVGVRFKSALGRGGIVQNIEINNINMVDIKNQAIILTMGYVLNRLNNEETAHMDNEDDIPYFKDITMTNMHFLGQKTKLLIEPIENREDTISNIKVNGIRYDGSVKIE